MNDREWVFTFGSGQPLAGYYVRFSGDFGEARRKMCEKFGNKWAFQYSASKWAEWEKDPNRAWMMEKELVLNEE